MGQSWCARSPSGLLLLLLGCLWLSNTTALDGARADPKTQVQAAEALIGRVLPDHASLFSLVFVAAGPAGNDFFEVVSVSGGMTIQVSGSSGVALASGVYWYLENLCNSSLSWLGDNINVPSPPPVVSTKVRVDTPYKYRYYFNVCTFGYSTVWWDWARWERELDWMALHGVNAPLAFNGQEYVWYTVWQEMGLTTDEINAFYSSPAFLPWQRMGNLDGWQGPLTSSWIQGQYKLQQLILARARSLGMVTVLPGFAGHVPAALKAKHPNANITQLTSWTVGINGTYFLSAEDPLFAQIGSAFIAKQIEVYGTDHLYNMDPFNELVPPSNDPAYLARVSASIYAAVTAADPLAIWVLQGWFLIADQAFWQPAQTKAFLSAVPNSGMVVLDLWSEIRPVWILTSAFYGKPFVWNLLHNFGGRSGLYGMLGNVNEGPIAALETPSADLVGLGMTMEAIGTNPIAYALLTDMFWRNTTVVLDDWVASYTVHRYGSAIPAAMAAWRLLQRAMRYGRELKLVIPRYSVYSCDTSQMGTSGSIVAVRPGLGTGQVGCCITLDLYYDPQDVVSAWELLLSVSQLAAGSTYQQDLVQVGLQALSNLALDLHAVMVKAYDARALAPFQMASAKFLGVIDDMDALAASQPNFLLGEWIQAARSWGSSAAESAAYEFSARTQVTLWAPAIPANNLHDYAYKLWSGLIGDFYKSRWTLFTGQVAAAIQANQTFDPNAFLTAVIALEVAWTTNANTTYPSTPSGVDTHKLAVALYAKYFPTSQ